MRRKIATLLALLFCVVAKSQMVDQPINTEIAFYDLNNEIVSLSNNAVIIVSSRLNCKGCYNYIKAVKRRCKRKTQWYCLFDYSNVEISQRSAVLASVESYIRIPNVEYLFIGGSSLKTCRESMNLCLSDYTPHLILIKNNNNSTSICHEELFSDDSSVSEVSKKINSFFRIIK